MQLTKHIEHEIIPVILKGAQKEPMFKNQTVTLPEPLLYEQTKHSINDEESALLHSCPLEEILTWTKAHLDAFLATAEVILEQNVDPG